MATDAAGEGINLQRAHLVINYDLPWNPNRIEQRFGRVHRIGQTEVCHMWNLVAAETREAQVYLRLLDKIEQQRIAYKGQVFDVLGEALSGAELRRLLLDAIRYGDDPAVRDRINQVIDDTVGARIRDAIEHPPLAEETLAFADVERIRLRDAGSSGPAAPAPLHAARSSRPRCRTSAESSSSVNPAASRLANVPSSVRQRDRQIGSGAPVLTSYERITFDKELIRQVGAPPAELMAPGHPLLTATIDLILERHRGLFTQGTVLVDDTDEGDELRVLVMLEHSIADGRPTRTQPHTVVSRRFEFVEIGGCGSGGRCWLRAVPRLSADRPTRNTPRSSRSCESEWLDTDLEAIGTDYAISVAVPQHLAQVRLHTDNRVDATLAAVKERLTREINYWDHRANELQLAVDAGKTPQANADRARRRADQLAQRLQRREADLHAERSLRALPPIVVGGALVVPIGMLRQLGGSAPPKEFAISRAEVERRAIDAVLAAEDAARMGRRRPQHRTAQPPRLRRPISSTRPGRRHRRRQVHRSQGSHRWSAHRDGEPQRDPHRPQRARQLRARPRRGLARRNGHGALPPPTVRRSKRGLRLRRHERQLHLVRTVGPCERLRHDGRRDRAAVQEEVDRGGVAAGCDQCGVGSGEVDSSWSSVDVAPVVGASAAGGVSCGVVLPAG